MRRLSKISWLAAAFWCLANPSHAGALQVSPISLEIPAPGAAATVNVQNSGATPIYAQIWVFRWTQQAGEEKLSETDAVVASPPMTALQPGVSYTIRIVRTARQPVSASEEYRLLIDELPDRRAQPSGSIKLLVRYSIPVFFYAANSAAPRLSWSVERDNGRAWLAATNAGDRHVRLASVKLSNGSAPISLGTGLLGYVLGRSTMRWALPAPSDKIAGARGLEITAQTNLGPIHATAARRGP